ncbi:MAG: AMP-binding protein, partial [Chthoniobacteraceae bacterium]|nr:AMP-binding protein [Chthoniobacteraceae bacterium]
MKEIIADPSQPACIHQLFEAQAQRTPDAVAVAYGERTLTYRELNRRANGVANHLLGLGVKPSTPVGLYAERSLELLPCILGILKAGAAYVPLDPQYPRERLSFIIADAQLPFILTPREIIAAALPEHQVPILCMEDMVSCAADANPATAVAPHHLAYIVYTSGSTGKPKGVMVAHQNVTGIFQNTASVFQFNEKDVWTFFHSPAFAVSVWEIWWALLHGCKLVVVPSEITRSPEGFYDLLRDEKVTILTQTPGAFKQLIQADETRPQADRLAVRKILLTGEALKPHLLKPWFKRHGDRHPQVYNMY